ncbi:MAG: hypothetical protein LC640_13560 [Frankia sp.]|nr:hypothetical protein [Frankia sp.]
MGTTHRVTLIPGDGVGPELTEATRRVLEGTGVSFEWDRQEAGLDVMEAAGTPLPDAVLNSIRDTKVAIKGPITTPIGTGFRSVNVALRKELELYACLRPCKWYPGVRSRYEHVDITIVRENTEDLYAGIEFEQGTPDAAKVISFLNDLQPRQIGLFLNHFREVAKDYPQIEHWETLVDALCMQLVQKPENYDVLVLPNLYGDIISDLAAGLVGGLGVAPGANIGTDAAVFEATHGSAPKYKGQNKVNPSAMILSGVLMLKHIGETDAAQRLEDAFAAVIAKGDKVTYDMKADRNDPSAVGTAEFADAIIEEMSA